MRLGATGYQTRRDDLYDASGTLSGTTPVLLLPVQRSRSLLIIQNTGVSTLYVDFGSARATAVMGGTAPNRYVSSVTVTNAGQGFSFAPRIKFIGGGWTQTEATSSSTPDMDSPSSYAVAHCVMTGTAPNMSIASIVVDNPGSGYQAAPFILIENDPRDMLGCVAASGTGGAGAIPLSSGSAAMRFDASFCPTTQVAIVGQSGGSYMCKYAL